MKTLPLSLAALLLLSARIAGAAGALAPTPDERSLLNQRAAIEKQAMERQGQAAQAQAQAQAQAMATIQAAEVTHVAVVIDTSGSMRDVRTNRVFAPIIQAVNDTLSVFPNARSFEVIDADGRPISNPGWTLNTPAERGAVLTALANYGGETISNPVPGLRTVLRSLAAEPTAKAFIVVIGDELAAEGVSSIPDTIARVNPLGADGKPRARISAIQVPTLLGLPDAADTVNNFGSVMRRITSENGGTFVQLDPAAFGAPPAGAATTVTLAPTWSSGATIFRGPITNAQSGPAPAQKAP